MFSLLDSETFAVWAIAGSFGQRCSRRSNLIC